MNTMLHENRSQGLLRFISPRLKHSAQMSTWSHPANSPIVIGVSLQVQARSIAALYHGVSK